MDIPDSVLWHDLLTCSLVIVDTRVVNYYVTTEHGACDLRPYFIPILYATVAFSMHILIFFPFVLVNSIIPILFT